VRTTVVSWRATPSFLALLTAVACVTPRAPTPPTRSVNVLVVAAGDNPDARGVANQFAVWTGKEVTTLDGDVSAAALDEALGRTFAATVHPEAPDTGHRLLLYIAASGQRDEHDALGLRLPGGEVVPLAKLAHQLALLGGHEAMVILDTRFPNADDDRMLGPFAGPSRESAAPTAPETLSVWVTGSPSECFLGDLTFSQCLETAFAARPDATWSSLKEAVDAQCRSFEDQKRRDGDSRRLFHSSMRGGQNSVREFFRSEGRP
jgi:hypothetical protein